MKILLVHNDYGKFSGEEAVFEGQAALLAQRGHEVRWFRKTSADILRSRFGAIRAFFSGIYSAKAAAEMRASLAADRPDIVQRRHCSP